MHFSTHYIYVFRMIPATYRDQNTERYARLVDKSICVWTNYL